MSENMIAGKHTPGPWSSKREAQTIVIRGGFEEHPIVGGRQIVAHTGFNAANNGKDPSDRQEANARLIAAAPCLLRSLQEVLDADEAGWPLATAKQIRAEARAAIAKATGGAS